MPITIIDAAIVTMSVRKLNCGLMLVLFDFTSIALPMIQNGLFKNFRRPMPPWYLDRHPDDQSLFMG